MVRFFPVLFFILVLFNAYGKEVETKRGLMSMTDAEKKSRVANLTELQRNVTQNDATEPPFKNIYWDHKAEGLYVDIVSGEALFSSRHKYDSGTGWPSFDRAVGELKRVEDSHWGFKQIELRSKIADSHLGHLFFDGPESTHERYCINSAALRFVPVEDLEKEGYGKYLDLFRTEYALFAGGCFWCMEEPFDVIDGVLDTTVGYAGGKESSAKYDLVSKGNTGHAEVVMIKFDPSRVSYRDLLAVFWRNIDPSQSDGQFCDIGSQYRSAIFPRNQEQYEEAKASLEKLKKKLDYRLFTTIEMGADFFKGEEEHQNFYNKNLFTIAKYKFYRQNCGRDQRLEEVWQGVVIDF